MLKELCANIEVKVVDFRELTDSDLKESNVVVKIIDDENIELLVNSRYVYKTLSNKDVVVGGINQRLGELIQQTLERLSRNEKEKNEGI